MDRGKLILLGLVAAILVFDGERSTPASVGADALALAPFGAEEVTAILTRVNPVLSAEQVRRISSAVVRYSDKYGIDPELVTAVLLVESRARPWARSPKGAVGLMQVMPHMMVPMEIAGNMTTIESNVEGGCLILADNIRRLGEEDGILAYFWGSDIRGVAYLHRVREARATVRRLAES